MIKKIYNVEELKKDKTYIRYGYHLNEVEEIKIEEIDYEKERIYISKDKRNRILFSDLRNTPLIEWNKEEIFNYSIELIRYKTNMSQRQFAEYLELSERQIQTWEQGYRNCPDSIRKLIIYKLDKEGLI